MVSEPSLRHEADALLAELADRFPLGYTPRLIWKRLRVSAGIAYYVKGEIALSSVVLTDSAAMRDTLIHEYAHLLAVSRHGKKGAGHGEPWKRAMRDLGAEPKVRHSYEVLRNSPRQVVVYRCLRCGKLLERSRRLPKRRRYAHVNCGGEIRLHQVRAA